MTEYNRRNLTFRQAEGLEPLPGPLNLGELTEEARALLWAVFYSSLLADAEDGDKDYHGNYYDIGKKWRSVMSTWWYRVQHKPLDEYSSDYSTNVANLKATCLNWDIGFLFDFITFAVRHPSAPEELEGALAWAMKESRMAYRMNEKTIWPSASPEEGQAIQRALIDLSPAEYGGARAHLKSAGSYLAGGDWAGSVRESIHAVESVAILIEPAAKTLSDALKRLLNADKMNPNLKVGLERLYAYTSDEKGIRHAKVFEASSVDQADAVYMLGACAAFVSFLIARRSA